MTQDRIIIKGARVHNLKNINVEIPKDKLVVITGLSGSGKSSLAFDTIYAEGQRRYSESLSSYARQFTGVRDKPDVDRIDGLSPTIAIDQKVATQNPRSTVGTVTEVYDYLRLLFARVGRQYCPECGTAVSSFSAGEITEAARKLARRHQEVLVLTPLIKRGRVDSRALLDKVEQSGYEWVRVNKNLLKINDLAQYKFKNDTLYDVDLLIGRITDIKEQSPSRLVEIALDLSNGFVAVSSGGEERIYSTVGLCLGCGMTMPILDMRSFSFNSPHGACGRCTGLGVTMEVDPELVVPNPRLTLAEGAIQPWTRITGNQGWYQKILAVLAGRYNFSLNTPAEALPGRVRNLLFYGTGGEAYEVDGKKTLFPGVVADLLQRHLETSSEYVRREIEQYMREQTCPLCRGSRLRRESLAVKINEYNIAGLAGKNVDEVRTILQTIKKEKSADKVYDSIIRELTPRLENLAKVGLGYLSLDRAMCTLSGGEVTRVRLSTQLSSGLSGVVYILDEPSVGLHPRDNSKLIDTLKYLRGLGNTVIVVEHDRSIIEAADYVVDIGPGAGVYGGEIVAAGTLSDIKKQSASLTGSYLAGRMKTGSEDCRRLSGDGISCGRKSRQRGDRKIVGGAAKLEIIGASAYNLKNINVAIPLGKLVCVTGVSGSGKSSLIIDILAKALARHFYRAKEEPGKHEAIKGLTHIDKVISVDQAPIGRTPRSNPATYTTIFTLIRDLFADLPEARMRGYDAGRFSFNVKGGGRCEACAGEGYIRIPMQFLADVFVECNECGGSRYNREALEIHYQNKNIADILRMTVEEAFRFFNSVSAVAEKLNVLRDVGLGYLELGQPATTLSGGEAQRIKLATELSRASTGRTLYILDEPTTGLHFEDTKRLLAVLGMLVQKGNTVIIIEHNPDVIKYAAWIIDLGPEGGKGGGELVVAGTPAEVAGCKRSWTGRYLTETF